MGIYILEKGKLVQVYLSEETTQRYAGEVAMVR